MQQISEPERFSDELEAWLSSKKPKTINGLQSVFGERSIAILILLLMILPALPLPTGGITHVFEVIVIIVAAGMIIGLKSIWVPKKWRDSKLSPTFVNKALPLLMRRIRWFENKSNRRLSSIFENGLVTRLLGLLILLLTVSALLAPPFTGLDTLPALGVVMIALAMLLEDALLLLVGLVVGAGGVALVIGLGGAVVTLLNRWF